MVWITEAKTPEKQRIYAIGDVHGCLPELQATHNWIAEDLTQNPAEVWKIVHVGDYGDRGPDTRGVIDYLAQLCAQDERVICLKGNHDLMFTEGLSGDARLIEIWLRNGADTTLASYGLSVDEFLRRQYARSGFDDVIPVEHRTFMQSLDLSLRLGDYFFVHAGIDPQLPIDVQKSEDLLWIRDGFIDDSREYDAVIVHGHTPSRRVDVRPNRIGIDTGAVYGGVLSCLILDGERKARLTEDGRQPLTSGR